MLYIGHPGHELAVWQWVRDRRPAVYVLTDGSGPDRASRMQRSNALLEAAGAEVLSGSAGFSDRRFYENILGRSVSCFVALAQELAERLVDRVGPRFDVVVGDAYEGYNTTHDVCRMVIDAAVERVRRRHGHVVASYEVSLDRFDPVSPPGTLVIALDDDALEDKRLAALAAYPELAAATIDAVGAAAFRTERLMPARPPRGLTWDGAERPYYERYGAERVAQGQYAELITYEGHVRPLAHALWDWATQ